MPTQMSGKYSGDIGDVSEINNRTGIAAGPRPGHVKNVTGNTNISILPKEYVTKSINGNHSDRSQNTFNR